MPSSEIHMGLTRAWVHEPHILLAEDSKITQQSLVQGSWQEGSGDGSGHFVISLSYLLNLQTS